MPAEKITGAGAAVSRRPGRVARSQRAWRVVGKGSQICWADSREDDLGVPPNQAAGGFPDVHPSAPIGREGQVGIACGNRKSPPDAAAERMLSVRRILDGAPPRSPKAARWTMKRQQMIDGGGFTSTGVAPAVLRDSRPLELRQAARCAMAEKFGIRK